jgi:hypothetical protein
MFNNLTSTLWKGNSLPGIFISNWLNAIPLLCYVDVVINFFLNSQQQISCLKCFSRHQNNLRDSFVIRSSTSRCDDACWYSTGGHCKKILENWLLSPNSNSYFRVPHNVKLRQDFIMTAQECLILVNPNPLNQMPIYRYYPSIHLGVLRKTRNNFKSRYK